MLGIVVIMCQLFVSMDWWLVASENVVYRVTCEHEMLYFAIQISFRESMYVQRCMWYGANEENIDLYVS
jgi:hypothetical protein